METQQIKALKDLLYSAQNSINSAKKILSTYLDEEGSDADLGFDTHGLSSYSSGSDMIIE